MSILPGTESWSEAALRSRITFLEACSARARELSSILGRNPPEDREPADDFPTERSPIELGDNRGVVDSLSEAAELSFCRGTTKRGLDYLRQAILVSPLRFIDFATLTRISVYAVLTGFGRVEVSPDNIRLTIPNAVFEWDQIGTTHQIAQSLPILVMAALASGSAKDYASILFHANERSPFSPTVKLAATASQEFALLGLFSLSRRGSGFLFHEELSERDYGIALGSLLEMEREYESRVQLMRNDLFHWKDLRARAELIDWRLLTLHVALIRRGRIRAISPTKPDPAPAFIRNLADEIVRETRG